MSSNSPVTNGTASVANKDSPTLLVPVEGDWISNPDLPSDPEPEEYVHNRSVLSLKGGKAKIQCFDNPRYTFEIAVGALSFVRMSGTRRVWKF